MEEKNLQNLDIYKIAVLLSKNVWDIYSKRDYSIKKIVWDQFIRSIDSIWANIAEWYGRFHYMDSVKFYYNARWSLFESQHRLDIVKERNLIDNELYDKIKEDLNILTKKLNAFIKSIKAQIPNS